MAVDDDGNIFIADTSNDVIREVVKATGIIITIAGTPISFSLGNGGYGYSGDNGPATSARLRSPMSVALDSDGNLYFADSYNNVIREVVKATGNIITVAGNGFGAGSAGNGGYSGDGGPATAAELWQPRCLALDSIGDIYFSDTRNNVIREVVKATGSIITVAGNGTGSGSIYPPGYSGNNGPATAATLAFPEGVALDSTGNLFIADFDNNVIREVVKATGIITTVAGTSFGSGCAYLTYCPGGYTGDGGPATAAELSLPTGLALDCAGNIFFSDMANNVIREVVKSTGIIVTVAGNGFDAGLFTGGYSGDNGPATAAEMDEPYGVALDSSNDLFIADTLNQVIREVPGLGTQCLGPNQTPSTSSTISPTPTSSPTSSASPSSSPTLSASQTPTASATCSPTPSSSPTLSASQTATPIASATCSPSPSQSPTCSLSQTPTPCATQTPQPLLLHLYPSSPNPFGSQGTYLTYWLQADALVHVRIYDVSGEAVRDLSPFAGKAGDNETFWDGKNSSGRPVASGVYIYRVAASTPRGEQASDIGKCAALR
jgi:hypothetical protein